MLALSSHFLGYLGFKLVLQSVYLVPELLGLGILLFALRNHDIDPCFLLLKGLDLAFLFLALVRVLLVVLGSLLLLEDYLVLVQLGEFADNLGYQEADLDVPLAGSVLLAVVLRDVCNLCQCLRHAVFYLLFLGLDVVRVVLQAGHLLLLDGGYTLVAILFN